MNDHRDVPDRYDIQDLQDRHRADPGDPLISWRLWQLRSSAQSSREAVRIFRMAALSSDGGVLIMAQAFVGLLDFSGEFPNRDRFDQEIIDRLEQAKERFEGVQRSAITWLLDCVINGARLPSSDVLAAYGGTHAHKMSPPDFES